MFLTNQVLSKKKKSNRKKEIVIHMSTRIKLCVRSQCPSFKETERDRVVCYKCIYIMDSIKRNATFTTISQ